MLVYNDNPQIALRSELFDVASWGSPQVYSFLRLDFFGF